MRSAYHPNTGHIAAESKNSFFGLIIITVILGGLINLLSSHLLIETKDSKWYIEFIIYLALILLFIVLAIFWDDNRMGNIQQNMELIIPYYIRNHSIHITRRKSYEVTESLEYAWKSLFKNTGLIIESKDQDFLNVISKNHIDLIRFVLIKYLADYGSFCEFQKALGRGFDRKLKYETLHFKDWPSILQENPFIKATEKSFPKSLILPKGCRLIIPPNKQEILIIKWGLFATNNHVFISPYLPCGQLSIKINHPFEVLKSYDKRYEELTYRFNSQNKNKGDFRLVSTRFQINIKTHMNFIYRISSLSDWWLNLTRRLFLKLDFQEWWEYKLKRTLADLDWKIGYISKDNPQSLIERIEKLEATINITQEHNKPSSLP